MRTIIKATKYRVFVNMETTCIDKFGKYIVIGTRKSNITKVINAQNKMVIMVHDSNATAQYSSIREAVERGFMKMTRTSKNNLMKAISDIDFTRRCTYDA